MKLKATAALMILLVCCSISLDAAPVWKMPAIRIQPNGDTLRCFVTGDEYYQRLHDADNYTIVMNADGYFVYADEVNGQLVPTSHLATSSNPSTLGLRKGLTISYPELLQRRKMFDIPEEYRRDLPKSSRNITLLNNIMIFIRFADDTIYTNPLSDIDQLLNDSAANAVSMYNFFKTVSYNHLTIRTHFYPTPQGQQILSYQDIYPRKYYMPYSSSDTIGYQNDYERGQREFDLIERATQYINENSPVDPSLELDCDGDGSIDNICYVVKGSYTGWADLLWPHKWNLYDRYIYINGKRVNTFNFMLAGAGSHYFGPSTFCHEMTHTLTAPDLYHYYNYTDIHPAGNWDLMEQNTTPPQNQTAWIKYKYCGWIDTIPTISEQGTYALASIDKPTNNCWRIPSPDPDQFYVLEYRNKQSSLFESGLPGSGLIISRIDTRFEGNASFDRVNQFDEVYILRPDGNDSVNGSPEMACFSATAGRPTFNANTNPYPMLTGNIPDTTWALGNIHVEGDSLYFDYIKMTGCRMPMNLNATNITGSSARLAWEGYNSHYLVEYGPADGSSVTRVMQDSNYIDIWGMVKNHNYRFRVKGYCDDEAGIEIADSSVCSPWKEFASGPCYNTVSMSFGAAATTESLVPLATNYKYSYTQQIFTANELGRTELSINALSFYYNSNNSLAKSDCKIYLGLTDRTVFSSQTDYVPLDSLTLVYSGSMNFSKGWCSIRLDDDFVYDGSQNIVLAIDDNSGASSDKCRFRVTNGSYNNTICFYSSSENPDPADPTNFVGMMARKKFRSNVIFQGCNANGEDSDLGIDPAEEEEMIITTTHLRINVSSNHRDTYRLYDISGRLLATAQGESATFKVPAIGVYVISTPSAKAHKVVVY